MRTEMMCERYRFKLLTMETVTAVALFMLSTIATVVTVPEPSNSFLAISELRYCSHGQSQETNLPQAAAASSLVLKSALVMSWFLTPIELRHCLSDATFFLPHNINLVALPIAFIRPRIICEPFGSRNLSGNLFYRVRWTRLSLGYLRFSNAAVLIFRPGQYSPPTPVVR